MKEPAYYNEIDEYAAEFLRNLIAAGHIASGVVDTRSIEDVHPSDLHGFAQHHFFAGCGVWSYALRRAGWADDRPVWTGSCPCQPFSAAGEGAGFADERHLWPAFYHLIGEHQKWCREQKRPVPVILGEQVASRDADPWIDLVQSDLEALGYGVGAVAFPSASVGAPHIRDRLYWAAQRVDNTNDARLEGLGRGHQTEGGRVHAIRPATTASELVRVANADGFGREMAIQHDGGGRASGSIRQTSIVGMRGAADGRATGPTNGFWRAADWLGCRDGKWRPVEPGTFPLAHGASARVGRLRAYGNAINAEAARVFIEAVMECLP